MLPKINHPAPFNIYLTIHLKCAIYLNSDMAICDKDSMEMLLRTIGTDKVLSSTEMIGTVKAIDPVTGKTFDHTVKMVKSIERLTDEGRYKIFEGNARRVYPRAGWH